ncbi:MAG: PcfJ domain-containing protein [Candidatus Shapirobacteria bacterium]
MKFLNYLLLERNIVNVHDIDAYINLHVLECGNRIDIAKWMKSNLRNYLLRQYPTNIVASSFARRNYNDMPWVNKALDRGEEVSIVSINQELRTQVNHIRDFFRANPNINISRMSFQEALRQTDVWVEKMNRKEVEEDLAGLKIVRKYPDGFQWVKVVSPQALGREGKLMKHCVGSYCDQVSSGRSIIYSLRDKKNEPHCTVEARSDSIEQIKGKANSAVDDKYINYVKDFVKNPVEGNKYDYVRDIQNIGMFEIDGKYFDDVNDLPKGFKVKGDLILNTSKLKTLPEGLNVSGNLVVDYTNLESLPKKLVVGGYLDASRTPIETLPKDIKVKSFIDVEFSAISSLPDNFKTNASLFLSRCKNLKTLPKNLKVGGVLGLSFCSIETLPNGLEVVDNLLIEETKITSLPDDLKVGGIIYTDEKTLRKLAKYKDRFLIKI